MQNTKTLFYNYECTLKRFLVYLCGGVWEQEPTGSRFLLKIQVKKILFDFHWFLNESTKSA